MEARLYSPSDLEAIIQLYYESIHQVCSNDYTKEQLDAWAPLEPDTYRWEMSLNKNHTIVIEKDDQIIGFGDMGDTGYIDRLYVHSQHLNQGNGTILLEHLEKYAKAKGLTFINTLASKTSLPFFESKGYVLIQEQTVERRGVRIRRYLMEKKL